MASDGRPLPPGWSAHRDERTGSMFYVNHSSQPATMSYAHPLDSAPQAAAVQQQVAAPPPQQQQLAHGIEYASPYTPSPQPSVSSGRSGSTGGHPGAADRAQPPGTVRELHTVATPPPPMHSHSRSVSMSASYAPSQQYVPPPPPPRLASNPNRTSTYTPRLPPVQVQPVQQQQPQQQQPSRVSALYAAQAGVQPAKTGGRWSSFFGTAKSQPFQQQIVPLQQSASRPPPATIYQQQQQQQRPPIVTQPFQQQSVSQQFVPQQQQQQQFVPQQQQTVPQQQQLVSQQQQLVPQQQQHSGHQQQFTPQQQVQPASAQQQFVAQQQHLVAQQPHQHQLAPQQMQTLPQLAPQVAVPQQQQISLAPQQQVVVPQQQQAGVQQNVAPPGALDPQVLLQLSALLAQQQGVEQAQILQQLLIAQQQLRPVSHASQFVPANAQAQQVPSPSAQAVNGHGGIPVTAPQPVHAVPAQLSLGLSPSPSPQSPQASLAQAHAAYAPGLGLYTAQQASPPSAVGSPPAPLPQSVTESPVLSAESGISSFDAAFPVDASRPSTSTPADAAVRPDPQDADYQQDIDTSAEAEIASVLRPEFGAQEESSFVPAVGPGEVEENRADSPGPLPAYSLEPPNSAPPMVDSFVAEAILQEMAQAAEFAVEVIADPEAPALAAQSVEVPASVELSQSPAPVESFQSPVSPTQYTPGGRTVRPALPPRPSGPRADRRLAGHAVSSHDSGGAHHSSASPAHGPAAASPTVPVPVAHAAHPSQQNGGPVTPAHAVSPPPLISSPNGALPQSHGPAHGVQSASYQPAMGVPPVGTLTDQTPNAQYLPAQQHQQQSAVQQQQQQQSPVHAQQQQQQSHVLLQQQQQQYPQQQQQQQQSGSPPPPPPPKPYAVYPDTGRQQSIGGRLSSFMSSPATQAIAAKGAGLLGNLFVRTAVNAVTDSDTASNYGYLNTGPSATDVAAGIAGNVVQNAIQQSIAPTPQPGLAGTPIAPLQAGLAGTTTQTQLIQAQIQAQAQANTNALLQSMQGSQQAQTAAALLQAQKIQAANAQATLQAQQQQQQQQQNVQAQLAALLKMQQQQQSAQQQAVLQHVQQQQAAQQAQQQEALQEAQQQAALQQAQQQAMLQQAQQQQAAQQAQQQAMLQQLQQQNDAQQQAALEQLQQQAAMYQTQQQAALEQMQTQTVFAPQVFASTNYEQPNGSGMDTLAQTISQAMSQQSTGVDPYSQAFSPDGGMTQTQIQGSSSDSDFLGALSQAIMGGVQTVSYDPSAYAGDVQSGADPSAMQAMTDALSQMQLGSEQMISGGFDGPQQTGYSQFFSSFTTSDIIDSAVANSV